MDSQSTTTAISLYSCNWQGKSIDKSSGDIGPQMKQMLIDCPSDVRFVRNLTFAIKRSQKPLMLRAMKFSALALSTFTRVSQTKSNKCITLFCRSNVYIKIIFYSLLDIKHINFILYITANFGGTQWITLFSATKIPINGVDSVLQCFYSEICVPLQNAN